MNLKPNLWTLLFLLTAAALFYVVSDKRPKTNDVSKTQTIDSLVILEIIKSTAIDSSLFKERFDKYLKKYIKTAEDHKLRLDSIIGVVNLPILRYKLHANQLDQMYNFYEENGRPKVYVYPTIKTDTVTIYPDSLAIITDSLDLVFFITDSLEQKGAYFDFTAPCPTLCSDTVQVPIPRPSSTN